MKLFPRPKKMSEREGVCRLSPEQAEVMLDADMSAEAYKLEIMPETIRLVAGGPSGVFYGQKTLAQIRQQTAPEGLPCLVIEDAPDFAERAFMLDISRCKVPTLETLKRLVTLMADFKMNQLQLYTEHTFAYSGHEQVWGDASPLTPADLTALDAWCREHFIELVPNQNSFGHMERWLCHPEYHRYAECPDGFIHPLSGEHIPCGSTLRPNEVSLTLLSELYAELLPCFSSDKFHVGCDETWELGQGWSKPLADAEGVGRVYHRFLLKVAELVQAGNRQMLYWADGLLKHPELIPEAPTGAFPIIWGYEPGHPFDEECRLLAGADLTFYVAPGDSTWNSFGGRMEAARHNIEAAARHGLRHGARGLIHTHWGDNGHAQPWAVMLPGLLTAAAASWNAEADGWGDLHEVLSLFVFGDKTNKLARALLALGRLDSVLPPHRRNRSLLFDAWSGETDLVLTEEEAAEASALLDSARVLWQEAEPQCEDASWILDEIRLVHGLCAWSLARLQGADAERLRPMLPSLFGLYETVWLRRNRVGGLHESSARLRKAWPQG